MSRFLQFVEILYLDAINQNLRNARRENQIAADCASLRGSSNRPRPKTEFTSDGWALPTEYEMDNWRRDNRFGY